ncbi:ubiquitin carboxyl-terminal hydrolase 2/21, partial [Mytilus galloprovincialis]
KPMKGVPNMGMTCYANSIFQILAQTQLFLSAIIPGEDMPFKPLTYSLCKVLKEINHKSENREVVRELLEEIANDSCFSSRRQDDCFEFLMHILERLKAENQQSTSMFEMTLQTVIEHDAGSVSHVDVCDTQLSFHLLVPFYQETKKDNPNVESCLNKMLNTVENFSGKELPCRFCSGTEAPKYQVSKHFEVSTAPDILILQIGRVEHMKRRTYSDLKKRNELVEYEHILHIDEVHWDEGIRTLKRNDYQLYGVVLHAGNIECGHYYCFVKHRNTSEWFYCNDLLVRQIHAREFLNDPNAYLLFYQKFKNIVSYK